MATAIMKSLPWHENMLVTSALQFLWSLAQLSSDMFLAAQIAKSQSQKKSRDLKPQSASESPLKLVKVSVEITAAILSRCDFKSLAGWTWNC